MSEIVKNKYHFVVLFDVTNGNPNGDPNSDNRPRTNSNDKGIITPECIKRKIRNCIQKRFSNKPGLDILLKNGTIIEHRAKEITNSINESDKNKKQELVTSKTCESFFDARVFGLPGNVIKSAKLGTLCGPCQVYTPVSIEPVEIEQLVTAPCFVFNEKDTEKHKDNVAQTLATRYFIPYALYRMNIEINPSSAELTGMTNDDLNILIEALINMFEDDSSTVRGIMGVQKIIMFKHESKFGNAPLHKLSKLVDVKRIVDRKAESYDDYEVIIKDNPFDNVEIIEIC